MQAFKQWWISTGMTKRVKSLLWHAFCLSTVAALNYISQSLINLSLPNWAVMFLGLLFAQVTKWLNNHTEIFGSKLK